MMKFYFKSFLPITFIALMLSSSLMASEFSIGTETIEELVADCPQDITVECGSSLDPVVTGLPTNLEDEADITYEDVITGTCPQVLERTFTITYLNNQLPTETCMQTITIVDTTPPVVTVPIGDENISCADADITTAQLYVSGQLTATEMNAYDLYLEGIFMDLNLIPSSVTDNCDDNLTWNHFLTYDFLTPCPQIAKLYCHFYAIDNCGNVSDTVTTVANIIDDVAPVFINPPADATFTCNAEFPDPSDLVATDDCNGGIGGIVANPVVITFEEVGPIITECTYTLTRTWTATDYCGNSTTHIQTITIVDDEGPVFSPASLANLTLQCDTPIEPGSPEVPGATAIDECTDDTTLSYEDSGVPNGCGTFTREWTAMDNCGNTTTAIQMITIEDNVAPVITCPNDFSTNCSNGGEADPQVTGFATATDNCATTITFEDGDVTGDFCTFGYPRTWTANDGCGNTATCVQTISIVDIEAPIFDLVPNDTIIECNATIPLFIATAYDNCDDDATVVLITTTEPGECNNEFLITNTWTAQDGCGNQSTATQVVKISDTSAPIFTFVPEDITISCDVNTPEVNALAVDSCGVPSVIFYDSIEQSACVNESIITRTFLASDGCQNISVAFQTITIVDTIPPVISGFNPDIVIQCDEEIPGPTAVAVDNCGGSALNIVEELTDEGCGKILTRTYVAVDNCGNFSSAIQTISIVDTFAPVLSGIPQDIEINCDSDIPLVPSVTALDNCNGTVNVNFQEMISNGGVCPYTITRSWSAKDPCQNTTTATQIITLVDAVINPEIIASPNPFDNSLRLDFYVIETGLVSLEIFDAMGRLQQTIYTGEAIANVVYEFPIETSQWQHGMYTAILKHENGVVKRQIIKL